MGGTYGYNPSAAAAGIFLFLFGATTILHGVQMIRTKTWFLTPLCIGGVFETVGYIARILSATASDPQAGTGIANIGYIVQTIVILVAPALFAASIYMELGRIAELTDAEKYLLVRRRWLTRIFVIGDVVSFFMQAGGGGIMSSGTASSEKTGKTIVVAGLFVQIIFFGCFVATTLRFNMRLRANPTGKVLAEKPPYGRHLSAMYIASVLIFARSIVRVVEFMQGFQGYIATHEVFLFIFDAIPMLIVLLFMSWVHPSEVKGLLVGGQVSKGFKMARYYGGPRGNA